MAGAFRPLRGAMRDLGSTRPRLTTLSALPKRIKDDSSFIRVTRALTQMAPLINMTYFLLLCAFVCVIFFLIIFSCCLLKKIGTEPLSRAQCVAYPLRIHQNLLLGPRLTQARSCVCVLRGNKFGVYFCKSMTTSVGRRYQRTGRTGSYWAGSVAPYAARVHASGPWPPAAVVRLAGSSLTVVYVDGGEDG